LKKANLVPAPMSAAPNIGFAASGDRSEAYGNFRSAISRQATSPVQARSWPKPGDGAKPIAGSNRPALCSISARRGRTHFLRAARDWFPTAQRAAVVLPA
jgi:hypothetical protein